MVTDRNYRRHVGKHQKIWTSADSRTLDSDSKAADGGTGRGDSRTGPDFDYKAPFMNVGQPLEVWESAAGVSSAAVAAGGGGATSNVGVGTRRAAGRGAGRDKDDDFGPPPVPVILGVNADEGLMFVHGAFPLTMPKVASRGWWQASLASVLFLSLFCVIPVRCGAVRFVSFRSVLFRSGRVFSFVPFVGTTVDVGAAAGLLPARVVAHLVSCSLVLLMRSSREHRERNECFPCITAAITNSSTNCRLVYAPAHNRVRSLLCQ